MMALSCIAELGDPAPCAEGKACVLDIFYVIIKAGLYGQIGQFYALYTTIRGPAQGT